MVPAPKKALKALKTKLPLKVSSSSKQSNTFAPGPGELPLVTLRVQILGASNLLAKDRNGFSDPFFVVSCLSVRHQTCVIKKTLDPSFPEKDATFDFDIYLSVVDKLSAIEFIAWDKDTFGKEYLGEAALPLEDWFQDAPGGRKCAWEDTQPLDVPLVSTRGSTESQGSVKVRLGFVKPQNTQLFLEFSDIYAEIVNRSRPSIVSAPPTEGIGTVRSGADVTGFQDDGLSSDDEDDEDDDLLAPVGGLTPSTDAGDKDKTPTPSSKSISGLAKFFPGKRQQSQRVDSYESTLAIDSSASAPSSPRPMTTQDAKEKKRKFRRSRKAGGGGYHFNPENDVVGIVMLEVKGANDLPKLSNMTRTGWDMDPCVVISFGKKVFRTRVIRHSLNPAWDEKLIFHVRRYESKFKIQFSVLDWDKLSSNDHIGDAHFDLAELIRRAPQKDPNTDLYAANEDGIHDLDDFKVQLVMPKDLGADPKYKPELTFSAKYQPYDALRQQFWRQYLKQYDADESGDMTRLEITSMLDSLGSTLSSQTINSFFTRFDKDPFEGSITISQVVQCLESEMCRPPNERKRVASSPDEADTAPATPNGVKMEGPLPLDKIDFSGPSNVQPDENGRGLRHEPPTPQPTEGTNVPLQDVGDPGDSGPRNSARQSSTSSEDVGEDSSPGGSEETRERVINIKNCPLCHRPRLSSKAEVDIVTHIALCASQDWGRMDKIVVGNFVTPSQAQRKWYTKIIGKWSAGDYRLGANSANIIVQNRMTGQLEEEKMQVYVRLGIRLLYKGAKSRMEGNKARSLLRSMSVKQGIKYDAPDSAKDIPAFIEFHNLNMDEILDPLNSFKSFNEFFYRKLNPAARPVEELDNPNRLVSGADCRLMAFESVNEATRIWIKGREFSVARLLGKAYAGQTDKYNGGALCIFRLAPQDYHRFHSPVDGKIGKMTYISGEYYTVNPQAIRTALDVYGENARKIVPIDSPQFGRVFAVCIGAMMVGTIKTTVEEGQEVKRGDEFGYFAFGGSTIVVLFESGAVEWDEDLLINGRASLETLVRVGMGIGRKAQ